MSHIPKRNKLLLFAFYLNGIKCECAAIKASDWIKGLDRAAEHMEKSSAPKLLLLLKE